MVCLFHSLSNNLYLILIDIRRIITIHNSICMVVYKYSLDIYLLCIIKFRLTDVENVIALQ